jgi:predicted  nucleic acid-binding Zn-ribbon protein
MLMNESPFKQFIDLITVDQAIAQLQLDEQKLEREIAVLHKQEQDIILDVEQAKVAQVHAQKEVDAKELEMETLVVAETEKKRRLELVNSHKEYQSMKAEIDTLQEKQQALEESLLHAWSALETTKRIYELKKASYPQQIEQIQTLAVAQRDKITSMQGVIAERERERTVKAQTVPQEWLDKYAAMRARVPDPVVPVVRGSCSACYYKVSEQDLLLLGRNKLLQCKDCYRFLYIESPDRTATAQ